MSYTKLIYHIIFRTHNSFPCITEEYEKDLYRYIWGIVNNKNGTLLRIGGMPDHIHMLVEIPANIAVSEFVKSIKISSGNYLRSQMTHFPDFRGWAKKYCALTYSDKDKNVIINYIKGQKDHHKVKSFAQEYKEILEKSGIDFDSKYLFLD